MVGGARISTGDFHKYQQRSEEINNYYSYKYPSILTDIVNNTKCIVLILSVRVYFRSIQMCKDNFATSKFIDNENLRL